MKPTSELGVSLWPWNPSAGPRRGQVFRIEPQQLGCRLRGLRPLGRHLGGFGVARGGAEGHVASQKAEKWRNSTKISQKNLGKHKGKAMGISGLVKGKIAETMAFPTKYEVFP